MRSPLHRRLVAAAVAVFLLAPAAQSGAAPAAAVATKQPAWPGDVVPGSVLVTTESDAVARALALADGGVAHGRVAVLQVGSGREARAASRLAGVDGVLDVEADRLRAPARLSGDPHAARQWQHELARTTAAWDTTVGAATVRVAVLDTGIDGRVPDLAANLVEQADVSTGSVVPVALGSDNDPCRIGHGTEVAAVLAASGDNAIGVAGVAWRVSLVDLGASDPARCGSFSDSAIIAGIDHARLTGVDVLNLSLGSPGDACPTAMQASLDAARAAGVFVVAAGGNENRSLPGATSVPASCNGVLGVGASNDAGSPASYSNVNDWIDLLGPGGDVPPSRQLVTTTQGGAVVERRGSSYASPYVAGVAALLLAVRASLTPDQLESVLLRTTRGTPPARTNAAGWGLVDAGAAVGFVASGAAIPDVPASRPFPVGLVARVSPGDGVTDPERQAVAMSNHAFDDGTARHAVLARDDDFADALAGSTLGYGQGPVLFTRPTGPLHPATLAELQRVLKPGSTVYVLGGSLAVPETVDAEITALGFTPVRLAGDHRAATAAIVSGEVQRRVGELGFAPSRTAIVVTADNWPDAATAGALGAWYGMPILLSGVQQPAAATTDELRRLAPERVLVVGGTLAVSDAAFVALAGAAPGAQFVRLAGEDRIGTALAVAAEYLRLFRAEYGFDPVVLIAVNLRRADAFPHVLSATDVIGAQSGLFLPLEGQSGEILPAGTRQLACRLEPSRGIVAGGPDIVAVSTKDTLTRLLERQERC